MGLPTAFAAVTSATGAQLDANFNAVGKIGGIPCTVSGTNSITMTPRTGITPTIAAYADGMQFAGVFAASNNAATILRIGALALLSAYKDTAAGVIALSGGECVIGCAFTAVYDSTLNTGAGGWHIYTGTGTFSGGTITNNLVLSGSVLSVIGGSLGVTLTSTLLTGNSLSIAGLQASLTSQVVAPLFNGGVFAATGGSLGATLTSTLLSGNSLSITAQNINAQTLSISSLASVTKLMIGASASSITRMISALGTLSFSITVANGTQDQTFALTGAQVNDSISIGLPASIPAGAGFTGYMVAAGTVSLRLINPTTVTLGAASFTVRATAIGFS